MTSNLPREVTGRPSARLAISGSAGVGKSTLARRLAAELGCPYLGEGMREYLEGGGVDLHALGHSGLRSLVHRLWEDRREAEAAHPTFVADRSSYDFGAFWLYYQLADGAAAGGPEDELTRRLLAEAFAPDRYDVVYLLPWGTIPLVADGVRSSNPYVQLHAQMLIEGCVRRHARRMVELAEPTLEARVAAVLADLGALAEGAHAR